jgi:hypothetical protein
MDKNTCITYEVFYEIYILLGSMNKNIILRNTNIVNIF